MAKTATAHQTFQDAQAPFGDWARGLEARVGNACRRILGRGPLVTIAPMYTTFSLSGKAETEKLVEALERAAYARTGPLMPSDQIRVRAAELLAPLGARKLQGDVLRQVLDTCVAVAEEAARPPQAAVQSVP